MLPTSERMAEKLKQALKAKAMTQTAFAKSCGVSKQAVQSWVKTGRVDKKHLPKFVEVLGYPLAWWLEYAAGEGPEAAVTTGSGESTALLMRQRAAPYGWPFKSVSRGDFALLSDRQIGMVEGYISALLNEGHEVKSNGTIGP